MNKIISVCSNNIENQPTKLYKAVKISIIAGALIVALSIAYYLVVFLPQKERLTLAQQEQEQHQKDDAVKKANDAKTESLKNLKDCLNKAEARRMEYLKINGTIQKNGSVWNTNDTVNIADRQLKDMQDNCNKLYPQQ